MVKQRTDWGVIQWLNEDTMLSVEGLKVGIVTVPAGGHQARHIHYEEQVIYVTQGQAVSILDGRKSSMRVGSFFHWKAGVAHELYNTGNVPFQHLLISNPGNSGADYSEKVERQAKDVSPDLIYLAVEAIRTQFLEALPYGYAIFDSLGNLVIQSAYFPDFCVRRCGPAEHHGCTPCMLASNNREKESTFRCRYGMDVFQYPVFFHGVFLGYIQGGYIRGSGTPGDESVYEAPESAVAGIRTLLRRIVKAMRNYCEFESFRRELTVRELCIAGHEETQRLLQRDLYNAQYEVTDLKINNHFLFNILNSMASMALDGGLIPLYRSIMDLSKMFRYTLRTQTAVVPLEKEIEYVRAYLQLQRGCLRSGRHAFSYASAVQFHSASSGKRIYPRLLRCGQEKDHDADQEKS